MLHRFPPIKDHVLESSSQHANAARLKASSFLDQNWSRVERALVDVLMPLTKEKLKDDKIFSVAVEAAYDLLPVAVRLVVPRGVLVRYALEKRDALLPSVDAIRALREGDETAAHNSAPVIRRPALFSFGLSQEFLQKQVQKEFPATFEKPMGTLTLANPLLHIEKDSTRIGIRMDVTAKAPLLGPKIGSVKLTGELVFPEGSRKLYVGEPEISILNIDGVSTGKTEFLAKLVHPALEHALKKVPVYEIPEGVTAKVIKDIYVADGKLRVALGL
ncbi:DUF1439 domain-containing protein [Azohydromonas aeria]|uniref:DUF1439 domain-containing protein n=1 Tax=Azohydromonas aeria TaxID=2590212 RepID=UPI0012FA230A|nr:DUF1439 domain-containing protein [Azohydromonas aeria]